ncbi:MAG: galactosyldiacylglycerol synthase [Chloroflexaceae bacterium]|nr:galactosyldiacylglycerol synthase [Chloroflexaceae bacterium]
MSKRVLVLSAKVGSGHLVAANALEQELAQREGITYANIDALEMTNDMFRTLANDLYMYLVKHTPHFVGWNYDRDDVPFSNEEIVRRAWTMMNAQQLVSYLKEFDPDITICTHFLPAQVVAQLLAQGDLHTTLSVVTTDYDFQGLWLPKMFTRFFVALEETRVQMIALGFDPERITVSGIPIDPTFAQPVNRAAVLAGYEIDPDRPLLLISAGAIGGGPTRDLVAQALHLEAALQIVVICGRNRKLRREVEALTFEQRERFRVLGFTRDMVNLVRCATLFVGKPGGLTTAECMAAVRPSSLAHRRPARKNAIAIICWNMALPFGAMMPRPLPLRSTSCSTSPNACNACNRQPASWADRMPHGW